MTTAPTVSDLLTVIITTSVTPTAPSTELLTLVLASFGKHCPDLLQCRVIVVFDGYDQIVENARLKKGQVKPEQAKAFDLYKVNFKALVLERFCATTAGLEDGSSESYAEAEFGSYCNAENSVPYKITQLKGGHVSFIEPEKRIGFGLAVRSALRITLTPYVWIHQHDWTFVADIPLSPLLQVMRDSEGDLEVPVKYVCLPAVRMLSYAISPDAIQFPALRQLTRTLKRDFCPSASPETKVPLTPLFLWHDKPHIALRAHYLERVFPTRLAMLRGDFIEDKIGQRSRGQMKEGKWHKWATWLYYPGEGKTLCLRHLQGRTWLGVEGEAEVSKICRQKQRDLKESLITNTMIDTEVTDEAYAIIWSGEDTD